MPDLSAPVSPTSRVAEAGRSSVASRIQAKAGAGSSPPTSSPEVARISRRTQPADAAVIRRWPTSSLESTKKTDLLDKIAGTSNLVKGIVLNELAERTANVGELELLLTMTDAQTLKDMLQALCPLATKSSGMYGSWVVKALSYKIPPAVCLRVLQAAGDAATNAVGLMFIIGRYPQEELVEIVQRAKTAKMVQDLFELLKSKAEVATVLEFLRMASPAAVLKAIKGRKGSEDLATVRADIVDSSADENSITATNGTVIKFYEVDNLPVPVTELPHLRNALEVFDGKAGPENTWRGQHDAPHNNKNGDLPGVKNAGGYLEHDVRSPTEGGAGTKRLVTDENSKAVYYTNTHYGSTGKPAFYLIRKP
ncbi:MAG TPA: ribonuclease domain-containing protein [Ilumatobacteraceae bacterium]